MSDRPSPLLIFVSIVSAFTLLNPAGVRAQDSAKPRQIEVGVHFSNLALGPTDRGEIILASQFVALNQSRESGIGGLLSVNVTPHLALEGEVNFFPRNEPTAGILIQGLFGAKIGRRFKRFGIFGKARPGIASFNDVATEDGVATIGQPPLQFTVPNFVARRRNFLSMDIGGVVELYHSPHVFTRMDVGDTIIAYGRGLFYDLNENTPQVPGRTRHAFQFSAGVGFRFR
jgi:hypothetical protein